jgi:hypothetical protein
MLRMLIVEGSYLFEASHVVEHGLISERKNLSELAFLSSQIISLNIKYFQNSKYVSFN